MWALCRSKWSIECPEGESLSSISSLNFPAIKDNLFKFQCRPFAEASVRALSHLRVRWIGEVGWGWSRSRGAS